MYEVGVSSGSQESSGLAYVKKTNTYVHKTAVELGSVQPVHFPYTAKL